MKQFSYLTIIISFLFVSCASTNKNDKKIDPKKKKADIFYAQGTRNLISKEYTRALKNLLKANKLDPNNSKVHNNLGMAYYFKGSMNKATRFVRSSIKLNPKNADARINLATIYMDQNKLSLAEASYNKVLEDLTYEGQYRTYYNLGLIRLKQRRQTQAIKFFNQSLEENTTYCPAHFQLGSIFYKKRLFKKALQKFKEAGLGTCYENPEPQYYQAVTLIKLKQFNRAEAKLQDIIERFPFTKYQSMAQDQLKRVKMIQTGEIRSSHTNIQSDRKILTPGF